MGTPKRKRRTVRGAQPPSVRSYFEALPADRREALLTVRDVVRRVFPHAHETLQYRMPTFEVSGSAQVAIAAQKNALRRRGRDLRRAAG